MGATTADLNPKTLEGAKRQFVELYGSALVTNTYLRIALALVSLVAVYPLVLAFQVLLVPRVTRLPLPLRALLFPLVLLTLMTFVVMPVVTRLLRRWLGPRQDDEPVEGGP